MKINALLALVIGLSFNITQSQEVSDAVRFGQTELHGTARFTAMSGAFGALGGDLSAIKVNPAGSAIFMNNQFAFTMGNYATQNNSNYFGTTTSANNNSFKINQAGGVFVFKDENPNSDFKTFSLAINYESTNNYDNTLFSAGTSPNNSIANYFLSYADGVPLSVLQNSKYANLNNKDQQAFLGYQGYTINPVTETPNNTSYTSNIRSGGNYHQQNNVHSTGHNGKLILNTAVQYKDKIYLGANLNTHFTDYSQDSNFYESNNNPLDTNYKVKSLDFSNNLHTYGSGFSFQIGAIAKITNEIRLGLTYESPTWYNLQDELSQKLTATSSNTVNTLIPDVVDPDIPNYYSPYNLRTPGSFTASAAYVFGKSGLISIDYKYKDYSSSQFSPTNDPSFRTQNNIMHNLLGASNEIRIGAEYKIKNFRLRGGYRSERSPYKTATIISDLNSFSGGLGYNFGFIKLDLAYARTQNNTQQQFFSQGFTESAKLNTYKNNITMTFIFEM